MHTPVLKEEVLKYLNPQPNEHIVDATLGFGGHTKAILEKTGPKGRVLGIEWDREVLEAAKAGMGKEELARATLVNDTYRNLEDIVKREKFPKVSGILLDLGMSSWHLEESKRGFSFQKNDILDMRYNLDHSLDAKKILNFWSRFDIEAVLKELGEEQFARDIAKAIVEARKEKPIIRTGQLVEIVEQATPSWYHKKRIHPATKTFQALRMAVNSELENIKAVLPQAVSVLAEGGRLAVISFHSLEDRIIKNFFRENPELTIITKKPITASFKEQKENPRARSAKLRVAVKQVKSHATETV